MVTAQGKSSYQRPALPEWPAAHLLSCGLLPGPGADAETAELGGAAAGELLRLHRGLQRQ